MPTKLRRIAVSVDPELAAALNRAQMESPGMSDAALLKKLALRGSNVSGEKSNPSLDRILSIPGVRPAARPLGPLLEEIGALPKLDSAAVDQILEEDRADRL